MKILKRHHSIRSKPNKTARCAIRAISRFDTFHTQIAPKLIKSELFFSIFVFCNCAYRMSIYKHLFIVFNVSRLTYFNSFFFSLSICSGNVAINLFGIPYTSMRCLVFHILELQGKVYVEEQSIIILLSEMQIKCLQLIPKAVTSDLPSTSVCQCHLFYSVEVILYQ